MLSLLDLIFWKHYIEMEEAENRWVLRTMEQPSRISSEGLFDCYGDTQVDQQGGAKSREVDVRPGQERNEGQLQ